MCSFDGFEKNIAYIIFLQNKYVVIVVKPRSKYPRNKLLFLNVPEAVGLARPVIISSKKVELPFLVIFFYVITKGNLKGNRPSGQVGVGTSSEHGVSSTQL